MKAEAVKDEDLALLIERDRSVVSRLRRGEIQPTHKMMEKIAEVTGGQVLPNDWFDGLAQEEAA